MTEKKDMRLLCEFPAGTLRNAVTVNHIPSVAKVLRNMPGIGKPFLIFEALQGVAVAVDFDMYPQYVVSADEAANTAMIEEQLATPPLDAVTFA